MCPFDPVLVPVGIDTHWTDEELLLFLAQRELGDPIPTNVITEVNPISIRPADSPENVWYMYKSEGQTSLEREGDITETAFGYWRPTVDHRIFARGNTVGRKITMEFYEGKVPSGSRTGWVMHKYQAEQETLNGNDKTKDYNTLCRVFLQTDRNTNHENQNYSASAGILSSGHVECFLLNILEPEESYSSSRDDANKTKTVPVDEGRGQSEKSSKSPDKSLPENFVEDMIETYDFSKEDYLELNDLYSQETSSASSENSSRMSLNSDAYFDADALRREIEVDLAKRVEEEHADCKFNTSATVKSNQVVIRPPSLGTVHRNSNLAVEEKRSVNSMAENRIPSPGHFLTTNEPHQNTKASTSGRSRGIRSNQIADSSRSRRNSEGNGLRSVSKIAKLGRKYCCLGSFCSDVPHL